MLGNEMWYASLPVEWSVKKIKYVASLYTGNSIKDSEKDNYTDKKDARPYIATKHIDAVSNNINYNNGLYVKHNDTSFKIAKCGSTLMCIEGGSAGKKKGFLVQDVSFVNKLCCFEPISGINSKYLFYYLMSPNYEEDFNMRITGLIGGVSISELSNMLIIVPPLSEQQAIADYLDEKCSKIDEIISDSKASIEEYKELRESVIFEAVTKGLDKTAEVKDSGYDFIGCIPDKWEMCKVRHLGTAQNGISIGGDAFGSGYPFVSYGDVYKNYSLPKTVDKLVQSSEEDRKRYSVEKGDWFFTRTSETIDEVGFSCVCEETIPDAVFAGFLIRVRPFNNRIYTGFAKYYFRSKHLRAFFVKEMNLVTRASLSQGLLKDTPVVVPPYDEQIEIANYLEDRCATIDGIIKDKESLIKDLEAYKKSLIYEVVTGKRRVA